MNAPTMMTIGHDLDSVADPTILALEAQAESHVREIHIRASRYLTAMRHGDPVRAQFELSQMRTRLADCEGLVDRLEAKLGLGGTDLRPCPACGAREVECRCHFICDDCGHTILQCHCQD